MTATALYILKVTLCSGILFSYYWFFLRNKAFHFYNRFYLLFAVMISLCLPLIKIDFWQEQNIQSSNVIQLLQAVSGNGENADELIIPTKNSSWNFQQWMLLAHICISTLFLFAFVHSLFIIIKLVVKYPAKKVNGIYLVHTTVRNTPFSFLHFIFWNDNIDIDSANGKQILQHEITHVKGRHSYDKLFMNLLLVVCWCNPFFWLIKKELGIIHEFIADKKAVADNDTSNFAAMILQAAYPQHNFQLTNNFFHSPIKRRLIMLTKNNNQLSYFSRILALPLLLFVFAAFTFKTVSQQPFYKGEKTIVIIDAGHGGKDYGAKADNGVIEKDITLAIAQKVKELNKNSNIRIILSRKDDTYQSPAQRIDFASNNKANLFISLHVDAEEETSEENKSGIHLFIPADTNTAYKQSEILGSALIGTLNENAALPVNVVMNKINTGAWILKANPCPAVLIETGYMTNKTDLSFITSVKGQETIAKNILNGVEKYLMANSNSQ
jgi:N-acetylmuramoyl-L-alanine amidase